MTHFFISYAKKDTRALALALADALEVPPHVTAWVDKELRATGSIWSRQIERQIQRCDYMVVLLSEDVNRSEDHVKGESFVLKEIEYMIQLKKERQIIVVLAQQTPIPLILIGKQYLDFTHSTDAAALADLICAELNLPRVSDLRRERAAVTAALVEQHTPPPPVTQSNAQSNNPSRDVSRRRKPVSLLGVGVFVLACSLSILFLFLTRPDLLSDQPVSTEQASVITPVPTNTDVIAPTETGAVPVTASAVPVHSPAALNAALTAARDFTGSNADWQAQYPDGFIHTFDDGIPMALVPAGCFMMGSTDGLRDEQPVHEQCFTEPFWIDLTEVTQADFARLGGTQIMDIAFAGADRPVETMTWFEARDFCARRAARLPTEREWEYAARGPDAWDYPWGNEWNQDNAVSNRDATEGTASVGSLPAGRSWVGAFDLAGNVSELTSSLYLHYDSADDREADTGNRVDVLRVVRGGDWGSLDESRLRAARRGIVAPNFGYITNGFRCARVT